MLRLSMFHRVKISGNRKSVISQLSLSQRDSTLCRSQLRKFFGSSKGNLNIRITPDRMGSIVDQNNIFMGPFGDVEIPSGYIHQFIWRDVDKWWNKTAIVCAVSGRSYTYGELRRLSGRFATSLRRINLRPGDTLAVILPNIAEFAIVVLGAIEAGVKLSFLNPAYTAYEISVQIENSDATAVITTQNKYPVIIESMKEKTSIRLPIILVPSGCEPAPTGAINFKDLVVDGIEEFGRSGERTGIDAAYDTALLPYSSGTTGLSKGVELTHRNIVANLTQMSYRDYTFAEPAIGEHQEIVPLILPAFHIYGLTACLLVYLRFGAKMVCLPQFTSNILLDVLTKNQATVIYVAPPIVQLIVNDDRFRKEHMECVKTFQSGAAPLGAELCRKFQSKMGTHFQFTQGYGLTETSPMIARSKYSDQKAVGFLVPNTRVRIVGRNDDNSGKNLGISETGEILVNGPQVMKGYYKNVKATEECMDGKWFKTGDLGHIDDKGKLFVTGRLKELIKVKGFQVAPAELEDVIYGHEKVADVAVIGAHHEKLGEAPKAFIVPKPGVKITEEEIKNYVAERLSRHKHIDQVQFIAKIPKSAAGKILRKALQKL